MIVVNDSLRYLCTIPSFFSKACTIYDQQSCISNHKPLQTTTTTKNKTKNRNEITDLQSTGNWFLGFVANIYVVNRWTSDNNRSIVWRTINLWFSKNLIGEGGNSCYSVSSLGNPLTYVKKSWCYEDFPIHHDLIYEPFDS